MLRALVAAVAGLLVAAGCGGDGDATTLRVGVVPVADVAPLYLGMEKGFFEDRGLTIEPEIASGGAAIAAAVTAGEQQIGFSNTVSLLIAAANGQAVQIISQGAQAGRTAEEAWAQLLVRADGPVREPADLQDATIAVNTLNNICEVTIKASLEERGVDVSTLRFTEVPFEELVPALADGRADGACAVEPYVTLGEAAGARGIDPFYVNTAPDLTVATYFTSRDFAAANPGVVDRFVAAMHEALEYAQAHPDEVRDVLPDYTDIDPEVADRIRLPVWRTDLNVPSIERLAELTVEYGFIAQEPDLDALIRR